jgi:uncharacterized membrane protein YbhN (UPF0104 family)
LKAALAAAVLAGAAATLAAKAPSLTHALDRLGHPQPGWLALALLAQLLSLRAYTEMVARLLARVGLTVAHRPLLRMTLGGIALTATLPGGAAASAAYWYRQLRRQGAATGAILYAIAGSAIAGAVSLTGLIVCGIVAAGDEPLRGARVPVLAATSAVLVVLFLARRRIAHRHHGLSDRFVSNRRDIGRPVGRSAGTITGLALANWLFDLATLYLSLRAVGANVPASGIVLVYSLGQVVQSLPLLPGGGGTVEASLALGFAAFGHTTGSVVAGVLLYRLLNTWGLVPLGWAAIAFDTRHVLTLSARTA